MKQGVHVGLQFFKSEGMVPADCRESFACLREFAERSIECGPADCITSGGRTDVARDKQNEPTHQPTQFPRDIRNEEKHKVEKVNYH